MIEAIVAYIESRGFRVRVHPGYLEFGNKFCGVRWMITQAERRYAHNVVLFAAADALMAKIDVVPAVEADFDKTMALFEDIEPKYSQSNRRLAEED